MMAVTAVDHSLSLISIHHNLLWARSRIIRRTWCWLIYHWLLMLRWWIQTLSWTNYWLVIMRCPIWLLFRCNTWLDDSYYWLRFHHNYVMCFKYWILKILILWVIKFSLGEPCSRLLNLSLKFGYTYCTFTTHSPLCFFSLCCTLYFKNFIGYSISISSEIISFHFCSNVYFIHYLLKIRLRRNRLIRCPLLLKWSGLSRGIFFGKSRVSPFALTTGYSYSPFSDACLISGLYA